MLRRWSGSHQRAVENHGIDADNAPHGDIDCLLYESLQEPVKRVATSGSPLLSDCFQSISRIEWPGSDERDDPA